MEFIFEVCTNKKMEIVDKKTIDRIRKMMLTFETMINITLPEIRVHLNEK